MYTAGLAFGLCLALASIGCSGGSPSHKGLPGAVTRVRGPQPAPGAEFMTAVLAALDRRHHPCDDFYRYACGGWLEELDVSSTIGLWQRGTTEVEERIDQSLVKILSANAAGGDGDMRAAREIFGTCMASSSVHSAALSGLLAEIDAADDADAIARIIGKLHRLGVSALFELVIHPRWDHPESDVAALRQASVLPARIYQGTELDAAAVLRFYRERIAGFLVRVGLTPSEATRAADAVVALEGGLAGAARHPEIPENPGEVFLIIERERLEREAGAFPWGTYLETLGHPALTEFQVTNFPYLQAMSAVVRDNAPATIRSYLRWRLLLFAADYLGDDIASARDQIMFQDFDWLWLDARTLRCLRVTETLVPEILARGYAEVTASEAAVRRAAEMLDAVSAALEVFLQQASWMSESTREQALNKARRIHRWVGLPSSDAGAPDPDGDLFGTAIATIGRRFDREAIGVTHPPPQRHWPHSPLEVNAFYLPESNVVLVPLAVLSPPMLATDRPEPMNYGALGFVLGHELSHAIFLPGRYYGAGGGLADWWSTDTEAGFATVRRCIDDSVLDSGASDARPTFSENLADAVGLRIAYHAWEAVDPSSRVPPSTGFSAAQLFFLSYAQTWCQRVDPFVQDLLGAISPHSPAPIRVNAAVRQMPEFAAAFACTAGTPMTGDETCALW